MESSKKHDERADHERKAQQYLEAVKDRYVFDETCGIYKKKATEADDRPQQKKPGTDKQFPIWANIRRDRLVFIVSVLTLGLVGGTVYYARKQWQEANTTAEASICAAEAAQSAANTAAQAFTESKNEFGKTFGQIRHQTSAQISAAQASTKAAQVARDTLKISERAYVTIGKKDGVVAEFIPPENQSGNLELVIYFQNSGHIPATLAWGLTGLNFIAMPPGTTKSSGIQYVEPSMGRLPVRKRFTKNGMVSRQNSGSPTIIIPGDSVVTARIGQITAQDFDNLKSEGASPLSMGRYEYCDELGTDTWHQFALTYQYAANSGLSFHIVFDNEMPLLRPVQKKGVELLSPCITVSETESVKGKRQKHK